MQMSCFRRYQAPTFIIPKTRDIGINSRNPPKCVTDHILYEHNPYLLHSVTDGLQRVPPRREKKQIHYVEEEDGHSRTPKLPLPPEKKREETPRLKRRPPLTKGVSQQQGCLVDVKEYVILCAFSQ